MSDFIKKMADFGYSHQHRKEIIMSGCIRYFRQMIEQLTKGKRLYRRKEQMKAARKVKHLETQLGLNSLEVARILHQGRICHF